MSLRYLTAAWETELPCATKIVLLALADRTNDQTEVCWPSIAELSQRTGLTGRGVQKQLLELENRGLLHRIYRDGRSTHYRLTPPHIEPLTPERRSPLLSTTPEPGSPPPPNVVHPPPNVVHPEPLLNRKVEPKNIKHREIEFPEWLPKEEWEAWLEMRKRLKCPPTEAALRLNLKKLSELREAGEDPAAVLDQSTMLGWRGLFPYRDRAPDLTKVNGHNPPLYSDAWIDAEFRAGRLKLRQGESYAQVRARLKQ